AFWILLGLLVLSALAIFLFTIIVARQEVAVQKAVLAAKQLGQYTLEEKIGAGGMGSVYKARHALLRRPTAVKLLEPDKVSEIAIARSSSPASSIIPTRSRSTILAARRRAFSSTRWNTSTASTWRIWWRNSAP